MTQSDLSDFLLDWPERRRSSALEADANSLGIDQTRHTPWPESAVPDLSCAIGMAYTLEGSRVGGAYMRHQILKACPDMSEHTRFLAHGHKQRYWTSFLAWLGSLPRTSIQIDSAINGARSVFGAYSIALLSLPHLEAANGSPTWGRENNDKRSSPVRRVGC